MGYTHDTEFAQFIAPHQIIKTAGSWTDTLNASVIRSERAQAAAGFSLFVPLLVPSNGAPLRGARLKSVEVHYRISGIAAAAFAVELERMTINAAGVVNGAVVAISLDAAHATDVQRRSVGDHRMLASLDVPAWVDDDDAYWLVCTLNAAASTVFGLSGAVVHYDFRV